MQDHELIKRIRQGEQTLFGELAGRYYNDIFRYCYFQTGNEQAAWDCTQETFFRLMRFLDTYTEKGRFKAYLLRIALNACRDWFRREDAEPSFTKTPTMPAIPPFSSKIRKTWRIRWKTGSCSGTL